VMRVLFAAIVLLVIAMVYGAIMSGGSQPINSQPSSPISKPAVIISESVRFSSSLNYPACRNPKDALDKKLAARLAYEGSGLLLKLTEASRTHEKFDRTADFFHRTRCLQISGFYFDDRGRLTQSKTWYPVVKMPQPEGVPDDEVALCIIYGLFQPEYTGEQLCSWIIVEPRIIERRSERS
jgi:hypothetical protein